MLRQQAKIVPVLSIAEHIAKVSAMTPKQWDMAVLYRRVYGCPPLVEQATWLSYLYDRAFYTDDTRRIVYAAA